MMRRLALSPRDRRALCLGALLVAPAVLWVLVLRPLSANWTDLRQRIGRERALLARERGLVLHADALHSARVVLSGRALPKARLLTAADLTAAGAELAREVASRARRPGVDLGTIITSEADSQLGDMHVVVVEARLSGDLLGVMETIEALEEGPRLLVVPRLSLVPVGQSAADDVETLEAAVTVAGLWQPRDTSSVSPGTLP